MQRLKGPCHMLFVFSVRNSWTEMAALCFHMKLSLSCSEKGAHDYLPPYYPTLAFDASSSHTNQTTIVLLPTTISLLLHREGMRHSDFLILPHRDQIQQSEEPVTNRTKSVPLTDCRVDLGTYFKYTCAMCMRFHSLIAKSFPLHAAWLRSFHTIPRCSKHRRPAVEFRNRACKSLPDEKNSGPHKNRWSKTPPYKASTHHACQDSRVDA